MITKLVNTIVTPKEVGKIRNKNTDTVLIQQMNCLFFKGCYQKLRSHDQSSSIIHFCGVNVLTQMTQIPTARCGAVTERPHSTPEDCQFVDAASSSSTRKKKTFTSRTWQFSFQVSQLVVSWKWGCLRTTLGYVMGYDGVRMYNQQFSSGFVWKWWFYPSNGKFRLNDD